MILQKLYAIQETMPRRTPRQHPRIRGHGSCLRVPLCDELQIELTLALCDVDHGVQGEGSR